MSIFGRNKDCDPVVHPNLDKSPVPRYCGRCGSPLVRENTALGYDDKTGCPKFSYWLRCPNWLGGPGKRTYGGIYTPRTIRPDWTDWQFERYSIYLYETDYLNCDPEPPTLGPIPPTPRRRKAGAK